MTWPSVPPPGSHCARRPGRTSLGSVEWALSRWTKSIRGRRNNFCSRRMSAVGFDMTPKNNVLTRAPSYVLDMFLACSGEPPCFARKWGPRSLFRVAHVMKSDVDTLINRLHRAASRRFFGAFSCSAGTFDRKSLKSRSFRGNFLERTGRELIVLGTIWKA